MILRNRTDLPGRANLSQARSSPGAARPSNLPKRFLRSRVELVGRPYDEGVRSCLRAALALWRYFLALDSLVSAPSQGVLAHSPNRDMAGPERQRLQRGQRHHRPQCRALPRPRRQWHARQPRPRRPVPQHRPWHRVRHHTLPHRRDRPYRTSLRRDRASTAQRRHRSVRLQRDRSDPTSPRRRDRARRPR
jgi:hypothetical protein